MYSGLTYQEGICPNQLQDMAIIGIILQKRGTIRRFAHNSKKPLGKKSTKKLKKTKSTQSKQKPFDPLSYTIRRASGKKLTTAETVRALDKMSLNKTIIKHTADGDTTAADPANCEHAQGMGRQCATLKSTTGSAHDGHNIANIPGNIQPESRKDNSEDKREGRQSASRQSHVA